jgi:hypothetical protein
LSRKPIPIQGTTLVLDSPEALDAWISERKRRWPTTRRIQDKKQKMDEAIARGQLSPEDSSRKRRKLNESFVQRTGRDYERNSGGDPPRRSIPNARRGGGWNRHKASAEAQQPPPIFTTTAVPSSSSSVAEPDDDKPEVISSKQEPPTVQEPPPHSYKPNVNPSGTSADSRQIQKSYTHQPRRNPPNPFASRPALLRNVRSTSRLLHLSQCFY